MARFHSILKAEWYSIVWAYRICSVAYLCSTLCSFMDCSPPGSSVHGIFQARILEWVAISSSRGSSWPRDYMNPQLFVSPTLADRFFTISTTWKAHIQCIFDNIHIKYIYLIFFIHLLMGTLVVSVSWLHIVNNAALNTEVHIFFWISVFVFFGTNTQKWDSQII